MVLEFKELDELSYPRRRPWIPIAIAVLIAVVLFLVRCTRQGCARRETEASAGLQEAEVRKPVPEIGLPATAGRTETAGPSTGKSAQELLAEGAALEKQGNLSLARDALLDALRVSRAPQARRSLEVRLGRINMSLLFSKRPMPEKEVYIVRSGDSVEKIAKRFGTTSELIVKSNGIENENLIQVGDSLRVLNGRFTAVVTKGKHEIVLYLDGKFCKRYGVGIGADDKTPTGRFVITLKEKEPVWWQKGGGAIPYGDERNILGTRWMAIKDAENPKEDTRGLGIHGTADETSIGKSLSAGCIRLKNHDVEELYALLPMGTPVSIVD